MTQIGECMPCVKLFLILLTSLLFNFAASAEKVRNCEWDNRNGIPCITISKTPNTSNISEKTISKTVITRKDIENSGALDVVDVLKYYESIDVKQNGQRGQLTSIFMRGTNSNHTLVLLNGIPINDQATTQGLHNFGQDFLQTIQQIEIYKGPNGAHFGPAAIGGAINFVTAVDYENKFSVAGGNGENSVSGNYTKILDNDWHVNVKSSLTSSKLDSARYVGTEDDSTKNYQINVNSEKWFSDDLKAHSTFYTRRTKSNYDASTSNEGGFAHDKMYVFQTGISKLNQNSENLVTLHLHRYDREYDESGYFDEYDSETALIKAERRVKAKDRFSYGFGTEYKYETAAFTDNGSWSTPSTSGDVDNLGFFGNAGYSFSEDTILSIYGRGDNHKTTEFSPSYKINLTQFFGNLKIGLTHSTALRNPSLYELYGNNGRTDQYKHVANPNADPETSETNELNLKYSFNENLSLENSFYRSRIEDPLLYNGSYGGGSGYTNSEFDLKQDGIESNLTFNNDTQRLKIYNTISSSKQTNGTHQLNRPDSNYGIGYGFKMNNSLIGPININYDYKHYGKSFDFAPTVKKVDSTDIMNISISKNTYVGIFSLHISNLTDEYYQRPYGYSQNGRLIRFGFKNSF